MKRYIYDIIAGEIGNKGGHGSMKIPHAVTIHHSGVIRNGTENGKEIAKAYCRYHKNYMPYHFLITRNKNEPIWCTQWVTQFSYHNANFTANRDCIAICVDGNFQSQKPSTIQLQKLKQLLDDISNNWFQKNNWVAWETQINPKDNNTIKDYQSVKVHILHWHNEVAQPGHGTACCGLELMPYILEYRKKKGKVKWGQNPAPVDPCKKVKQKLAEYQKKCLDLDIKYAQKHTVLEKLKRDYIKLEKEYKASEKALGAKNEQIDEMQEEIDKMRPSFNIMDELYSLLSLEGENQTPIAVKRKINLLKLQKDSFPISIFKAIAKWLNNFHSK